MEYLDVISTIILAISTAFIAWKANNLSRNANEISLRATTLEADKHLIEWAQRVLGCFSSIVALRHTNSSDINRKEFEERRREHKSTLHALKEEGQLFLAGSNPENQPALVAIGKMIDHLHGKTFRHGDDYETVCKLHVKKMRDETRNFMNDIQARIGDHWRL